MHGVRDHLITCKTWGHIWTNHNYEYNKRNTLTIANEWPIYHELFQAESPQLYTCVYKPVFWISSWRGGIGPEIQAYLDRSKWSARVKTNTNINIKQTNNIYPLVYMHYQGCIQDFGSEGANCANEKCRGEVIAVQMPNLPDPRGGRITPLAPPPQCSPDYNYASRKKCM